MRRVTVSVKLEPAQATHLQELAGQCGLTLEQMASAICMLALDQQLNASRIPPGPIAQRLEQATHNCPVSGSSPDRPTNRRALPDTGFLRLTEIVGSRAKPGEPRAPRLIPISRSTWLAGVKSGVYPRPVKLGAGITAWRVEDIRALIQDLGA